MRSAGENAERKLYNELWPRTMVENRKKHRQNSHPIIHCPMSEVSKQVNEWARGGPKQSEQSGASERVSGTSEQANGRASGPVLTSQFLADLNHSAMTEERLFTTSRKGIQRSISAFGCLIVSPLDKKKIWINTLLQQCVKAISFLSCCFSPSLCRKKKEKKRCLTDNDDLYQITLRPRGF